MLMGTSAELSEAINSMYKWYQDAEICYVCLNDTLKLASWEDTAESVRKARWFTRGCKYIFMYKMYASQRLTSYTYL